MAKYSSFKYGGAKYGSLTYKINNTDFTLPPTSGRWLPRVLREYDGNGRAIYETYRNFELSWNAISVSDFDQLQNWYANLNITGSVTATLPKYGGPAYALTDYASCLLQEPEIGAYYNNYVLDARMLITRITT